MDAGIFGIIVRESLGAGIIHCPHLLVWPIRIGIPDGDIPSFTSGPAIVSPARIHIRYVCPPHPVPTTAGNRGRSLAEGGSRQQEKSENPEQVFFLVNLHSSGGRRFLVAALPAGRLASGSTPWRGGGSRYSGPSEFSGNNKGLLSRIPASFPSDRTRAYALVVPLPLRNECSSALTSIIVVVFALSVASTTAMVRSSFFRQLEISARRLSCLTLSLL